MEEDNFYEPEEVRPLHGEIVPAYQEAFKDWPWYELSKCPDAMQRCIGGLSALAIGEMCNICEISPSKPAYEPNELIERFEAIAASRPTVWYTERNSPGLTLAAVAWKANPSLVATEKYQDVPEMKDWLEEAFGTQEIIWLDEVFANKSLKASGNLKNFGAMCVGLMKRLGSQTIAYRTISPAMTRAAIRDFAEEAMVLERYKQVPDRRDFVILRSKGNE